MSEKNVSLFDCHRQFRFSVILLLVLFLAYSPVEVVFVQKELTALSFAEDFYSNQQSCVRSKRCYGFFAEETDFADWLPRSPCLQCLR